MQAARITPPAQTLPCIGKCGQRGTHWELMVFGPGFITESWVPVCDDDTDASRQRRETL